MYSIIDIDIDIQLLNIDFLVDIFMIHGLHKLLTKLTYCSFV